MSIINKANAMPPPNEWSENIKECKIKGKIIYLHNYQHKDCENIYDVILKDDNNYYNVTFKEILPSYMEYIEGKIVTKGYERVCEGYTSSGTTDNFGNKSFNSIKPKVGDDYYFTIRHFYDYYNYSIKYSNQEAKDWNILPNCTDNIIDKVNKPNTNKLKEQNIKTEVIKRSEISKNIDIQNNNFYFIILLIILLPILSIYIYKKIKKI